MKAPWLAILAIGLIAGPARTQAEQSPAAKQEFKISPELTDLLRAEMREIAGGVQSVTLSLATGDWKSIQDNSELIRASYIMERQLTPAQADELEQSLPEEFKQLDAEFHQRAEKLGAAAAGHDSESVAYHLSRLLESCVRCHAAFASTRFPGFASPAPQAHQH